MVTPTRRVRRRFLAGVALALAAAVIVVLVLRSRSSSSGSGAQAVGSTGLGVATVRRRNLVATDTESGTLAYAGVQTVYNRLSGTITWLPSVGQVIKPGQTLFRVGDQPVILMKGSTPAYRDLSPSGAPGPDIAQLNRNLIKLGFDAGGIVADDEWQTATSDGVELLQESLGEPPTGTLSLGDVVFLPGPQLVSTVDATVGGTGGGGGSSGGSSGGSDSGGSSSADLARDGGPAAEDVSLRDDTGTTSTTSSTSSSATTSTSTTHTTSSTTSTASTTSTTSSSPSPTTKHPSRSPSTEPERSSSAGRPPVSSSGARSGSDRALSSAIDRLSSELERLQGELHSRQGTKHPSSSDQGKGTGADPGATEILQTSSTRLDVTVDLAASSQSEAVVGRTVDVEMPAGNVVKGTIVSVSRVAQSSSSGSSGASGGDDSGSSPSTVPVTIRLHNRHAGAGLDQAAVSVDFVQASARHVLSVPVTALVATSGQTYALQAASAPHRLIAVHTGLFAAGYVQVSGPGVVPGLRVTDSEG